MSWRRRATAMRGATIIITTTIMIMIMITTTRITATPTIGTATTRASARRRLRTAPMAVMTTTTTILARLMDAPGPEPPSFAELPLLLWLSPAFPVGSFAYSHGLEWAAEAGDVVDAATLEEWLGDLLRFGAPRSDAVLFACAFRAARSADWTEVEAINALAVALAGSAERRLETCAQGSAFLSAMRAAWACPALARLPAAGEPVAYPVAVGVAAAGHALGLEPSLQAFALSLLANLVSAAARLGTIGQTDGQKTLAALLPDVRRLALEASGAGLDDLGTCAFRSDIAAMRHETQYSRLFRS